MSEFISVHVLIVLAVGGTIAESDNIGFSVMGGKYRYSWSTGLESVVLVLLASYIC